MRPINFTLGAGDEDVINQAGDKVFVYLLPSTGNITIEITDNDQNIRSFANQGTKIYALPFSGFTIRNNGAASVSGQLLVGTGDIDIPIPGVVEVLDGSMARTLDDGSFHAYSSLGAVASNYNHHQLFNPAASGYQVIVNEVYVTNQTADGHVTLVKKNSAISVDSGNESNLHTSAAGDDVVQSRTEQSVSGIASDGLIDLVATKNGERTPVGLAYLRTPLVLDEGYGLMMVNSAVNQVTRVAWNYYLQAV